MMQVTSYVYVDDVGVMILVKKCRLRRSGPFNEGIGLKI